MPVRPVHLSISCYSCKGHLFAQSLHSPPRRTTGRAFLPKRAVKRRQVIKQYSIKGRNRVANPLRMAAESLKLKDGDSYLGAHHRLEPATAPCADRAVKAMAVSGPPDLPDAYQSGGIHYEQKRQDRDLVYLKRQAATIGLQLVPAV